MICLANSKKYGGWCIAGLRADGGGWVRPVAGDTEHGQLYRGHMTLQDGSQPQTLDLLRVPLDQPRPLKSQPENWTTAPQPWELLRRPLPAEMHALLQHAAIRGAELLGSPTDRVPETFFDQQPTAGSLALIAPDTLQWRVGEDVNGQWQLRALFRHRGTRYKLAVTDVEYVRRMRSLGPGSHPFRAAGIPVSSRVYLLISLSEPLNGICYKLVAGVINL